MFGKDLVVAASSKRRSSRKITPRVQSTTTAIIVLASLIASGLFGNPALQRHAHLRSVLEATSVHARLTVESDEEEEATGAISQLLRRFEVAPKSSADAGEPHYLVVCRKVESYFLPVLSKFKVIRLEMGDNPPPWNAKAILHAEKCMTNPYVVEALERRKRAPFLAAPTMSDTSPAVVYGVRWPSFGVNNTKYLRTIHDRPAIVKYLGEVFWRRLYKCADVDFVIYREIETLLPDCLTIHYIQGASTALLKRGEWGDFGYKNTTNIFDGSVPHPHKSLTNKRTKFCSIIIGKDPTQLMDSFQNSNYDIDVLVRLLFFSQLSEYKPCERVTGCPGNPDTTFLCMVGYKFHINMENTQIDGYVTEKLFNGALGSGVPIYFGAPDVGKYANDNSFVHCIVNRSVIEEMRTYYPRGPKPRQFLFSNSSKPTNDELRAWADGYLRPELEPCVQRVIELDRDEEQYLKMLREPFVVNNEVMSGEYSGRGVSLALDFLGNNDTEKQFGMQQYLHEHDIGSSGVGAKPPKPPKPQKRREKKKRKEKGEERVRGQKRKKKRKEKIEEREG